MIQHTFFKDLRILEISSVLAGPAVGQFFAELGAKVIKIENLKTGGDVTRKWKLPNEAEGPQSAYYQSINWGKEHILMDLSAPESKNTIKQLIAGSDILISNFKKGAAKKLGLESTTLRTWNKGLIHANLTGFGEDNARPAFDVVLQAETGFLSMSGTSNGELVKMPVALIDLLAAHQMKEAILIALLERYKTGKGAYIAVSLAQSAVSSLANQASNWLNVKHQPQPMGTQHPNIAPYGDIYQTKDGQKIVLAIGTENHFKSLCHVLKIPQLLDEERFNNNQSRVKNRTLLNQQLQEAILQLDQKPLLLELEAQSIPAGQINDLSEVFQKPYAKELVLDYPEREGIQAKGLKTVAFKINWY